MDKRMEKINTDFNDWIGIAIIIAIFIIVGLIFIMPSILNSISTHVDLSNVTNMIAG